MSETKARSLLWVAWLVLSTVGCDSKARPDEDTEPRQEDASAPALTPTKGRAAGRRLFVFNSAEEIAKIKAKIEGSEEPWRSAYEKVKSGADAALSQKPRSVVDNGAPAEAQGQPHRFGTDRPYVTDGVYDQKANREDYRAATDMGNWVRDLALAYRFSGRTDYAEKCIDLLFHWAVDPAAYMEPRIKNHGPHTEKASSGGSIEIYITIPKFFYAASLVLEHPHWETKGPSAREKFLQWVRGFLNSDFDGVRGQNNIRSWQYLLRASAASLLDDDAELKTVFSLWEKHVNEQIDSQGKLFKELRRTRSLHYSLYGLKALTLTAEIARQHGVNLYDYEDGKGGSALHRAFDFHAPYLRDLSTWPHQEIGELKLSDEAAPYEFAHSHWATPLYRSVLTHIGRPLKSNYVMGHLTLTHGDLFELTEKPKEPKE